MLICSAPCSPRSELDRCGARRTYAAPSTRGTPDRRDQLRPAAISDRELDAIYRRELREGSRSWSLQLCRDSVGLDGSAGCRASLIGLPSSAPKLFVYGTSRLPLELASSRRVNRGRAFGAPTRSGPLLRQPAHSESGHQLSAFWVRMRHGRAQHVSARARDELPANETVEPEPEERASLWARLTIGLGLLLSAAWSGLLLWGIVSLLKKLI
jgi:hypothetical protein